VALEDVDTARMEVEIETGGAGPSVLAEDKGGSEAKGRRHPKKKSIKPRPVPFFEREGHVLYVGNERAEDLQGDS